MAKKTQDEEIKKRDLAIQKLENERIKQQAEAAKERKDAMNKLASENAGAILALCNKAIDAKPLDSSFFSIGDTLKVCMWGATGDNIQMADSEECKKNKSNDFFNEIACSKVKGFDLNNKIMAKLNNNNFTLLHNNVTSGILPQGIYKVKVAGGAGGRGGGQQGCSGDTVSGGNGSIEESVFVLTSSKQFIATIGTRGSDASGNDVYKYATARSGGNGTPSKFSISGVVDITAAAGKGGGGVKANYLCRYAVRGKPGANGGNGRNSGTGYLRIYRYKF